MVPSLQQLKQLGLARCGLQDGWEGKTACSEAVVYGDCFRRGRLFRRASAREIAVVFGPACQCQNCRTVYEGAFDGTCFCGHSSAALIPGVAVAHGPAELDDDLGFMSDEELWQLCAGGTEVVTMNGERLNEQILLQ